MNQLSTAFCPQCAHHLTPDSRGMENTSKSGGHTVRWSQLTTMHCDGCTAEWTVELFFSRMEKANR